MPQAEDSGVHARASAAEIRELVQRLGLFTAAGSTGSHAIAGRPAVETRSIGVCTEIEEFRSFSGEENSSPSSTAAPLCGASEELLRLQEEFNELAFRYKEAKLFQNRHIQELEAQVQRLERQYKRSELGAEQVCASSEEHDSDDADEASAKLENELHKLHELNGRLLQQVQKEQEAIQLTERRKAVAMTSITWQRRCLEDAGAEVARKHAQLDELAAHEGELKLTATQLRNRASLLQRQVSNLESTSELASQQLQEAEEQAGLDRLAEEMRDAERRVEQARPQGGRPHRQRNMRTLRLTTELDLPADSASSCNEPSLPGRALESGGQIADDLAPAISLDFMNGVSSNASAVAGSLTDPSSGADTLSGGNLDRAFASGTDT